MTRALALSVALGSQRQALNVTGNCWVSHIGDFQKPWVFARVLCQTSLLIYTCIVLPSDFSAFH